MDRKQWNNIITIFVNQTATVTGNNKLVCGQQINFNYKKSQISFSKAPQIVAIKTKINIKHFLTIHLNFICSSRLEHFAVGIARHVVAGDWYSRNS